MPPVGHLQLIAVQGLRRYGYYQEASLLTKFISLVIKEFEKHGTLLEKNYDVYSCDSDVSDEIHFGYSSMKLALVGLTQYYWNY